MTTTNPLESIADAIACSPDDWSLDHRQAWVYGIVHGWGNALPEVAQRHHWSPSEVERLRTLHAGYAAIRRQVG